MLEAVAMTPQPGYRLFRILWSGPIFHAHELFGNAHWRLLDSFFGLVPRARSIAVDPSLLVGRRASSPGRQAAGRARRPSLHFSSQLMQSDADTRLNNAPSHDAPTAARCHPTSCWRRSETFLPASTTRQVPL